MRKSFLAILLLFAISIQSANVMARIKEARESQAFTPTKYWLKEGEKLEDSKDNAEAELKVLVTSREYRDKDGKIKKTKDVEEVVKVIKNLQNQGANIYQSKYSKKGNTPLHTAVNNRRLAVVQALL